MQNKSNVKEEKREIKKFKAEFPMFKIIKSIKNDFRLITNFSLIYLIWPFKMQLKIHNFCFKFYEGEYLFK